MKKFRWRTKTKEGTRFYSLSRFGKRWNFSSKLKDEEEWTSHQPITLDQWRMIRPILWNLYQRKRCSWGVLAEIDKILEEENK